MISTILLIIIANQKTMALPQLVQCFNTRNVNMGHFVNSIRY